MTWKLFQEDWPPSWPSSFSLSCIVSLLLWTALDQRISIFGSNNYLEIFASGCKHEKCSGKCQNKVIANIPLSSNTSRSFPYKTFPCCVYWDVFWCPQRLPGQGPCAHYKVLPCTILGLSLVSLRAGTGKWSFSRTLGLPVGILPYWGLVFSLNFSTPVWVHLL